jgi:photosystem II stability/assembly factor-like uncharacterized protein
VLLNPVVFWRDLVEATWHRDLLPSCAWSVFNLRFWDLRRGIALGDNSCAYFTETGGETWTMGQFHDRGARGQDEDAGGIPTVFFFDHGTGWLSSHNGVYKTGDGGKNWYRVSAPGTPHFDVFAFLNANRGFGIARQSEIYESQDAGRTWRRLRAEFVPRSLYILDKKTGWVLSDSGVYRILD